MKLYNKARVLKLTMLICACFITVGVAKAEYTSTLDTFYQRGLSPVDSAYTMTRTDETSGENVYNIPVYNETTKAQDDEYYQMEIKQGAVLSSRLENNSVVTEPTIGHFVSSNTSGASNGGAIYNTNKMDIILSDFINNSIEDSSDRVYGGAIYNTMNSTIGNITGDFINNTANGYGAMGGAISNTVGKIGDVTGNFIQNSVTTLTGMAYGGAICNYYRSSLGNIIGNFVNNSATSAAYDAYGGAIYNYSSSQISSITGNFINNSVSSSASGYVLALGGAIYNINSNIGDITGNFSNNSAIGSNARGGAICNEQNSTINNITGDFNNNTTNGPAANGGAIYNDNSSTIGNISGSFVNNYAVSKTSLARGGAIYSQKDINIVADNKINVISGNYTISHANTTNEKDDNAIYLDSATAKLTFDVKNNGQVILTDNVRGANGYKVDIIGDKTGTFNLYNDLHNANFSIGNANLNTINDSVKTYSVNSFTLTNDANMSVDVDLANEQMDKITANTYGEHTGTLKVTGMNLLSDSNNERTEILFAEQGLKDNVVPGVGSIGANTQNQYQTTAYSPIYKYDVNYDNRDLGGYFVFNRSNDGSYEDFNPAVLATAATTYVAAMQTQAQTFNYAFQNSDNYMALPLNKRLAVKNANMYAMSPDSTTTDVGNFSSLFINNKTNNSVWFKPYTSFENIPLKNGPKVNSTAYGAIAGFDSEMKELHNGFDRVMTYYLGYNGSYQSFNGVNANQNGGLIGTTATFYKNNFFNATAVSVGASTGQNRTMYGNENFTVLAAGIGNKTGYNFEFSDGKFILQPNVFIGYTFVNTFDYKNAANIKIHSQPINAIQVAPGVKLIGNLPKGWQPYLSANMVWNILDKSRVTADNVRLPEMSIKPYVQYGLGVQRIFQDRYMAFGQAMVVNGGRNGVSLSFGMRIMLGK